MKILIVEDEVKLAHYLKKWLKQQGYIAETVFDGEEAENFILMNHETLDLILLDEMLPYKNGSEICKLLRQERVNIPVLMLTAKDLDNDIISGLNAGADDYLTKPFSLSVLAARMQALLRRSYKHSPMEEEIQIGNLLLNITMHKILYNQQELNLTLKEYNLLEYLIKHPNIVVEREKLLENVWDANFDSFSNVVDVQVTRLRKKLKQAGDHHILETVRGVGFRLKI